MHVRKFRDGNPPWDNSISPSDPVRIASGRSKSRPCEGRSWQNCCLIWCNTSISNHILHFRILKSSEIAIFISRFDHTTLHQFTTCRGLSYLDTLRILSWLANLFLSKRQRSKLYSYHSTPLAQSFSLLFPQFPQKLPMFFSIPRSFPASPAPVHYSNLSNNAKKKRFDWFTNKFRHRHRSLPVSSCFHLLGMLLHVSNHM